MHFMFNKKNFTILTGYVSPETFIINMKYANIVLTWITTLNSLSASLLLNIFLSFEVGIAHAIANFKWKENTSSLKN